MRNRIVLKAVHDVDLVKVLKRLGIYNDIIEGKYRCFVCGRKITLENLGGMFRSMDGKINLVCDNIKCLFIAAEITSKIGNR